MSQSSIPARALLLPVALLILAPSIAAAASRISLEENLIWIAAGAIALLTVPAVGSHLVARGTPFVAALCSTVLPGLGQVVNGHLGKSFLVFVLCVFGLKEESLIGGFIFGGAWLCGIADAARTAYLRRTGSVTSLPVPRAIFIEYVVLGFAVAYALP